MTRSSFLASIGALLAAPFVVLAAKAIPTGGRPTLGFIAHGIMPAGTHLGNWTLRDALTGENAEMLMSRRYWATDDGKPVTMYSIQWCDDRTGTFGGQEDTYTHWTKGKGLGKHIFTRAFHHKAPVYLRYHGTDPRYAAFKATPFSSPLT